MKKLLILLVICFASTLVFAQAKSEPAIKKLSISKKKQISKLLNDVALGTQIYSESTENEAIVIATAETIKRIRKLTPTLPKSLLRDFLVAGAGAWEKSLWFRYDEIGNSMMSMSYRSEIIKVYKLESIAPEDRPARLFEFAQTSFDMAANIAVASGVSPQ